MKKFAQLLQYVDDLMMNGWIDIAEYYREKITENMENEDELKILEKEIKDVMYEKGIISYFDLFDDDYFNYRIKEAIKFVDKNNLWNIVDENEFIQNWKNNREFTTETFLKNPFGDGIDYDIRRFVKIDPDKIEIHYFALLMHEDEELEFNIDETELKRNLEDLFIY